MLKQAFAGALVLLSTALAGQPSPPVRLTGTFLQLWSDHRNWPSARWELLFDRFAALQLRDIYVQWIEYDGLNYEVPLATILKLAEAREMKVHVGLAFHSSFWNGSDSLDKRKQMLARHRHDSIGLAKRITGAYRRSRAFAGWYLPEEINHTAWRSPEERLALFDHLRETVRELRRLDKKKPISISAYADIRTQPAELQEFWTALLRATPFTDVLFQDGIGVGNLGVAYVTAYLGSMQSAAVREHRRFHVIAEIFRQVDGDWNGKPFRAVPAEMSSLIAQLEADRPCAKWGVIAFAVPEYMTPESGPEAAAAFHNYLAWLANRR